MMREHEVPTHVQAEDKVLLGLSFPKIVAMVAVCALGYGVYHYFPFGPMALKLGIAIAFGVVGLAMTVGRVGGRGLPLVAADLLKHRLGARFYAGPPAQVVKSEAPAPVGSGGDPLRLLAKRAAKSFARQVRQRKRGRRTFRPHAWLWRRRWRKVAKGRNIRRTLFAVAALAVVAAALPVAAPQSALADSPEDGRWTSPEIYVPPPPHVPGRRIYVERLAVSGNTATVSLRAATGIELRARAFGGATGKTPRFFASARLAQGESIAYAMPLHGPKPSLTFDWEDGLGQAGALTLKGEQIPHPLPSVRGELCDLELASLEWTPGSLSGVIASQCVSSIVHTEEVAMVTGHRNVTERAALTGQVTSISGQVVVWTSMRSVGASFVPNGSARFRMSIPSGRAIYPITLTAYPSAQLSVPIPPVTRLTYKRAWTQTKTRTVYLYCGLGDYSQQTVTLSVHHPARVEAKTVSRQPLSRSRSEVLQMAVSMGSDDNYQALQKPAPTPTPDHGRQSRIDDEETRGWFDRMGWGWPW